MLTTALENITKIYDNQVVAVKNVNLEFKPGEFIVLVGPSGCGKSTILRMIAGLEEITEGTLYIGETKANNLPAKDRDIAMVFQNYALYPHMSVFDNMAFHLKLKKTPRREIHRRVAETAETLEISDLLKRKPHALSGGQRQRVALGRAMIRNPSLFLLDEPLSNLDAKLRTIMRLEIMRLHQRLKQTGTTFIYVTHDQVEAMTMGDRIVVMKDGILMQMASPRELYWSPENLFVAEFIGTPSMNFFAGQVMGTSLEICGFAPTFTTQNKVEKELEITLGIRPEHLVLSKETNDYSVEFTPDIIENTGDSQVVYGCCQLGEVVVKTSGDAKIYKGEPCFFHLNPRYFHLFNKQTEERCHHLGRIQ